MIDCFSGFSQRQDDAGGEHNGDCTCKKRIMKEGVNYGNNNSLPGF